MALPKLCQVGILINILYLIGWVVALIGLALSQDWCADNQALIDASEAQARAAGLGEGPGYTFLSHERGTKCRSLYRCAPAPPCATSLELPALCALALLHCMLAR